LNLPKLLVFINSMPNVNRCNLTSLDGKVAIVTGASAGIGKAIAETLAQQNTSIVIVGRTPQRVQEVAESLTAAYPACQILGLPLDVAIARDMSEMADKTLARFGRIDILVASAGILRPSKQPNITPMWQMNTEAWDEVININLRGTFLSNRAVLPAMLQQGAGQIINIASKSALKGRAFDSAYCASKFGVIGLSQSLGEEVGPKGIRVQTVLPGAFESSIWSQNRSIPHPQGLPPVERVADLVLYLLTLPSDTICPQVVVEPIRAKRPSWLKQRD
jgi:NAD(P)-dependent dehydrogenase (short-subunit alcohol dehydrogenase family)